METSLKLYSIPLWVTLYNFKGVVNTNRWNNKLRPNLKNLSRGLNLSRGSKWFIPLKIVLHFARFKPALN